MMYDIYARGGFEREYCQPELDFDGSPDMIESVLPCFEMTAAPTLPKTDRDRRVTQPSYDDGLVLE
jgi:hypothetical protein